VSEPFGPVLPRAFFARDAVRVARALLGKTLVRRTPAGLVAGRIVETEAYRGPDDRAAHSAGGRRTPRNEVMWGPPGFAYVYFVYGMHWCLNAVCAPPGKPEAVLLRAVEPLLGLDLMRARRLAGRPAARGRKAAAKHANALASRAAAALLADEALARGPANLCRAFAVDRALNGAAFVESAALSLHDAPPVAARRIAATPRVGVDYAGEDALLPWRFCVVGSPAVSAPRPA
jgi:DNA-3-methyladenine glycosylase